MTKKYIINTDEQPKIPYGEWKVASHIKQGKLDWNKIKPELYLSEKQKSGYIGGEGLLKELEGKNPLNVNVLWYLLEHQELIPKEWEVKYVYFFGTIFMDPRGGRGVLFLCRSGGGSWGWGCRCLGLDWDAKRVSLVSPQVLSPLNLDPSEIVIGGRRYKLIEIK